MCECACDTCEKKDCTMQCKTNCPTCEYRKARARPGTTFAEKVGQEPMSK